MTELPVRSGWTLALVSVCAFLTSLDVMVVVTAIPTIRQDLDAELADLEWTINAYNLAFGCLMLIGAALGDRFGRLKMYVLGLAMFTAASALAALAPTIGVLIVARALQGIAAGVAIPVSLTLLSSAYPPHKRGMAMGIWGSVSGLAVAVGPVVGGLITQGLSWHWIFWLNVPVGVAATVLSAKLLRESYGPRPTLDLVGLALVSIGLFGLVWAAIRMPLLEWNDPEIVLSALGGLLLLVAFVRWEKHTEHPMLPMSYFRNRGFAVANVSAFFQHLALIGSLFMLAQMFQEGFGHDPVGTGLRLLAWTVMPLLVAPIAGGFADRLGNRPFMIVGLLLQGVGLAWIAAVARPDVGFSSLFLPLVLGGVGIAMCLPTTINLVFASVPADDVGVASGVNSAVREIGGVFGVVFLGAAFAARGHYGDQGAAMDGFQAALLVGAIASLVGMLAAVFAPGKSQADTRTSA
ncbi:MFS transporter [Kribbella deserti]|uniref:MFS transporter n=1 Tax=Kribbella deserti TaxID=1926257 RepID=A0ABV6QFN2_9ACTN